MSVGSVSFWKQDQNYWARSQQDSQTEALSAAVIGDMFGATTTLSGGLSSIANQTALSRVNTQLTAAVQSALQGTAATPNTAAAPSSSSSTASSPTSSSSGSTSPAVTAGAPAVGTGTVPLTPGTSLFALGILASGTVKVSDGTFTTTYTSTGSDTVGDLLNGLNASVAGHANVAAWLNSSGKLVISGKDDVASITVAGTYASAVGFGSGNNSFQPTAPTFSSPSTSSSAGASSSNSSTGSSSSSGSSTASASSGAAVAASGIPLNSARALQTTGTAEILLAGSGVAGSILNLLA